MQHFIGGPESIEQADFLAQDRKQPLIGDRDQGIDVLGQLGDSIPRDLHALGALERERAGDHRDGENSHFPCDLGDDRSRTSSRPATHAGGDEEHVGAANHFLNALPIFHGRLTPHLRIGTSTQPLGDPRAQLQQRTGARRRQHLSVGVCSDEIHAFDACTHHVGHGIAASTADPDHLDDRVFRNTINDFKHDLSPHCAKRRFVSLRHAAPTLHQKLR